MDYKEKIKQLIHEGKINSEQATLLLNALKESEERKEKIFRQVLSQKKKREQGIWGVLSIWIVAVLVFIGFSVYLGGIKSKLGRDVYKALDYFNQASTYMEKEEYGEAIKYCKKAIKEAPRFSLGYSLMGANYRLLYEKTGDSSLKEEELTAFKKANEFKNDLNRRSKMNNIGILFAFVFLILVLGSISVIVLLLYNSLVRREEQVNEAWAQVGTLYQRKLDLIPALLEAVKNYAQHEKDTLQAVTEARTKAQLAIENIGGIAVSGEGKFKDFLESQGKVMLGLGKLFALVESYPDLKANVHFLTIQQQLQETEDQITQEREIYNNRVREYNSNIRYFPANLISALFRFGPKEYFKIDEKIS